jgi:DNA polymerase I-like protein with 3'-5' exonuclease and polymerase domains
MLINGDVKSLEIVTAAYLSRDKIMMQEVRDGVDMHGDNQVRFNLPERRIAKIFVFRLLYGGTHYANDPQFSSVSSSQGFWDDVIEAFYTKYKGVKKWHEFICDQVARTGCLILPTGRKYQWEWTGDLPHTQIKNYPVQGLGAEMVKLARIHLWNMLMENGLLNHVKFISSVHDSIVLDVPKKNVSISCHLMRKAVEETPRLFEEHFSKVFDLPMKCEIQVGPTKANMEDWNG